MAGTMMNFPVIPSKFAAPTVADSEVRRTRLDDLLASDRQVTVVTAPAGFGKSTSVAGWIQRTHRRSAWVSLDSLDRSPLSFWRYVTASIAGVVPGAREAEAILVERGRPGSAFVAALAHALWEDGGPLVLVIDDLHHGNAAMIRDVLVPFVEACRGPLELVAISRSDPPLPTQRWLSEGRAVEIRMDALAFRTDEAISLMRRFEAAGLGDADVERLNAHVEGWPVGLILSGLALDGRPDLAMRLDDLIGSDRHLTDYLVDEVLDRLPDDLRSLALVLSIPPTFDLALAQRLVDRPETGALLERLVRSNPFVMTIASPPAYRFHRLFRSLLSANLRWSDPMGFERAHRTVAAVMIERGHVADALASLLEIGAVDEAFDLVSAPVLQTMDQGRVRELGQWLEMLGDVQTSDATRALEYAQALMVAGRPTQALDWVNRAAEIGDPADLRCAAMRVTALAAAGSVREAGRELAFFDAVGGDDHASRQIDSRLSSQLARIALAVGDLERAEQWLPHVARHPAPAVSEVLAPALRSWLHLELGEVGPALDEAGTACDRVEQLGLRPHHASFDAFLSKGSAEALALRLHDLAATLHALDEDVDALDLPFFVLRLWPLRVQAQALQAGWPAALELSRTLDPDEYPSRGGQLSTRRDELHALALLNCGLDGDAEQIVGRLPMSIRRALLTARSLLVRGRHDEVEAALTDHEQWLVPHRLEALLLLAQARAGDDARATMERALELGQGSGAIAPFVLEGRRVERLLADMPVDELHPGLAGIGHDVRQCESRRPVGIVEPLTAKELEVLARLPSHATYRAIGAQLHVSVNTVKTYVRAVYRKLGVSTRAEAVDVARRCGLLDG